MTVGLLLNTDFFKNSQNIIAVALSLSIRTKQSKRTQPSSLWMKGMKSRILKKLNSIPQQLTHHLNQVPIIIINNLQQSNNKENINHPNKKLPTFHRPDPNSPTLFDPQLLSAFQQAITDHLNSLDSQQFPSKCPPGGSDAIILYTTTLHGVRTTFEQCRSIKSLLENLKLVFIERDLSMHSEFREELWSVLGYRAIPPRLFVKGRYIGAAEDVLRLHERGRLMPLVQGMPRGLTMRAVCEGCEGVGFGVCGVCDGGRKVFDEEKGVHVKCFKCNENGLIVCRLCSK